VLWRSILTALAFYASAVSFSDKLLFLLRLGTPSHRGGAGKPGSRKRKVVPLLPNTNDMSQLPAHMLMGTDFTAPRVKRAA